MPECTPPSLPICIPLQELKTKVTVLDELSKRDRSDFSDFRLFVNGEFVRTNENIKILGLDLNSHSRTLVESQQKVADELMAVKAGLLDRQAADAEREREKEVRLQAEISGLKQARIDTAVDSKVNDWKIRMIWAGLGAAVIATIGVLIKYGIPALIAL